jgi:putative transcriptional regulator
MSPRRPTTLLTIALALTAAACSSASDIESSMPAAVPARGPGPAQGKLLVAQRQLKDPNFSRTVVLLLHYDSHGATGLIVNRPSEVKLAELLPELEELKGRKDPAYIGGPVHGGGLHLLARSESKLEEASSVVDGVWVSRSRDLLERLLTEKEKRIFRVYVGYAGWAPRQLDAEIERGDWHVTSATADDVFDDRPDDVWFRLRPPEARDVAALLPDPTRLTSLEAQR